MTISENNNKLIKDWIRPLQKSLTIETENKFINTLGREKYFNDYLHESFKKLDNLNLSDEYLRIFYKFSKKYNEYNKLTQTITLYRKSFPGTVNSLNLSFPFDSVKSIKMKIQEGLNPKRQLFLCLTDNREIPLTGLGEPIALTKLENEAITLAKYLNVFLETE